MDKQESHLFNLLAKDNQKKPIIVAGAGVLSDTKCPTYITFREILAQDDKLQYDYNSIVKNNDNMLLIFWHTLFSFYNYGTNQIQLLTLMEHGRFDILITSNYDVFLKNA